MQHISVDQAEAHFADLINTVMNGEEVVILKDGEPIAHIVPTAKPRHHRKAGSAKGQVVMTDDFDAPLEEFDSYTR